jgi:hypothetical protein
MHLRSSRVRVQIARLSLARLPHNTTPQELSSARVQGNCQGKNFPIPKASQPNSNPQGLTAKRGARGWTNRGHDQTDHPTVAKSPPQLTNIHRGTTEALCNISLTSWLTVSSCQLSSLTAKSKDHLVNFSYPLLQYTDSYLSYLEVIFSFFSILKTDLCCTQVI